MTASAAASTPQGPGSVAGAPGLPPGFAEACTSRSVATGDVRQHVVIGPGQRAQRWLPMPVPAIGGALSPGERFGQAREAPAEDVRSVVVADTGHRVAEDAPGELLAALATFLAPYRDGPTAPPEPRHATADVPRSVGG